MTSSLNRLTGGYRSIPAGAAHPAAVVNPDQVRAIRAALEVDGKWRNVQALAEQYGVKPPTIYKIRNRERWKHLD